MTRVLRMQCAQAKNLIALLVGDDISDAERPQVEQHLTECESCRVYHGEIQETQKQLLSFAVCEESEAPGLWSEMQTKVGVATDFQPVKRSNKWTVALCTAALVMAMIGISKDLVFPTFEDNTNGLNAAPVSWPHSNQSSQSPNMDTNLKDSKAKRSPQDHRFDTIR